MMQGRLERYVAAEEAGTGKAYADGRVDWVPDLDESDSDDESFTESFRQLNLWSMLNSVVQVRFASAGNITAFCDFCRVVNRLCCKPNELSHCGRTKTVSKEP